MMDDLLAEQDEDVGEAAADEDQEEVKQYEMYRLISP